MKKSKTVPRIVIGADAKDNLIKFKNTSNVPIEVEFDTEIKIGDNSHPIKVDPGMTLAVRFTVGVAPKLPESAPPS